jgi:Cdc6-like AAA superfamily ATPase
MHLPRLARLLGEGHHVVPDDKTSKMIARGPAGSEPLLVGRQREVAVLWRLFEAAVDGRPGVVLVAGEPGIGKTHLLEIVA